MRDDWDCSDTFQTKTELTSKKISNDRVVHEASRRSQTGAIGMDGRKGEYDTSKRDSIESTLEQIRNAWIADGSSRVLRSALLSLLTKLDDSHE